MLKALKGLFGSHRAKSAPASGKVDPAIDPGTQGDVASRVDALYARAVDDWNRADYVAAAARAADALALDPALPVLHLLHAGALLELGDHAGAAATGERGLALCPPYPLRNELQLRVALARARADGAAGTALPTAPMPDSAGIFISVIICTITPAKFASVSRNYARLLSGVAHEIIGIHDAQSLCEGYNRGARQARGHYLVFSHDDLEIVSDDFAAQLVGALAGHDLIGIAGTTRARGAAWIFGDWPNLHGQVGMPGAQPGEIIVTAFCMTGNFTEKVQAMDGVFMAARRELVEALWFDAATFDGWHLYDMDFSWRAHRAGYRCAVLNTLLIVHQSTGNPDAEWRCYAERFLEKNRGEIVGGSGLAPPALSAVTVRSAEEWRRLTAHLVRAGAG